MSKNIPDAKMAPPAPAPAPANGTVCVLGPTLHFKGELYGEEDLEFQGQLEGSIEHTRSLSIGKEGGVTGNIKAKFVIVEGRVDGDIYATESVSVRQSAKVKGNIYAPRVGIADGAQFSGSANAGVFTHHTLSPLASVSLNCRSLRGESPRSWKSKR
jgi:cytoskeletal protein CcmA (bactofilin family)